MTRPRPSGSPPARRTRPGSRAASRVLAVDGGNSKADLALVTADGRLLSRAVGPSISHQAVGLETGMANLAQLAELVAAEAGLDPAARPLAAVGAFCLAGADNAAMARMLGRAIGRTGLVDRAEVRNDSEAPLWAGTPDGWGVAVVSGAGINAIGRAPNGRTARFAGLGDISGDDGGAGAAGMRALGAAARAQERRGPRTSLEQLVPAFFGLRRPLDVTYAIELARLDQRRLRELAPIVFRAATDGDPVARSIVDHLADEAAAFATAAIRRLGLTRRAVPVVLSGGLSRTDDAAFFERFERAVRAVAPAAIVTTLAAPPVLGAALLGINLLGASRTAAARLRRELGPRA